MSTIHPASVARLRTSPEEELIKFLKTANDNPTMYLKDRAFFKDHLKGIYNAIDSLYKRDKNRTFGNNLIAMLANHVSKLTPINYSESYWDRQEEIYRIRNISEDTGGILASTIEKNLQVRGKYNDFSFDYKITGTKGLSVNSEVEIKTSLATYSIPFNGKTMNILVKGN
ncbi:MAG: hypothetical protein Nk1A_8010 [Endomicrobiia bacterium]|nr:MAG: hypothetical protein Nk1A_8010 [Endomicrobiia bacterium]